MEIIFVIKHCCLRPLGSPLLNRFILYGRYCDAAFDPNFNMATYNELGFQIRRRHTATTLKITTRNQVL
ncbi:hypothetical protein L1887_28739 [Cichorium endivia]|nr:hypothetical protein L1887_28739 [Cichorium endivia]